MKDLWPFSIWLHLHAIGEPTVSTAGTGIQFEWTRLKNIYTFVHCTSVHYMCALLQYLYHGASSCFPWIQTHMTKPRLESSGVTTGGGGGGGGRGTFPTAKVCSPRVSPPPPSECWKNSIGHHCTRTHDKGRVTGCPVYQGTVSFLPNCPASRLTPSCDGSCPVF